MDRILHHPNIYKVMKFELVSERMNKVQKSCEACRSNYQALFWNNFYNCLE